MKFATYVAKISSSIDSEEDVRRLVRQQFLQMKNKHAGYSLRRFAKSLGIQAPIVSEILSGKRRLTYKLANRILIGLQAESSLIQQLLSQIQIKRTPVNSIDRQNFTELNSDQFALVADWWHFAIISLSQTIKCHIDPAWISERLGISKAQAKKSVTMLLRLGYIEKSGDLLKNSNLRLKSTVGISSDMIKKNHLQGLELARSALLELPIEKREFSASIIAANPTSLQNAKKQILKFRRKLSTQMEIGQKSEVYRLQIQLYPLTKLTKEKL